jgi:hypothetical protein
LPQKDFAKNVFIQEFGTKFKSAIKTLKRMIRLWCKISANIKQLKCVDDMTKPPPGSDEFFSLSLMRSTLHNFTITMCPGNIRKMSDIDAFF